MIFAYGMVLLSVVVATIEHTEDYSTAVYSGDADGDDETDNTTVYTTTALGEEDEDDDDYEVDINNVGGFVFLHAGTTVTPPHSPHDETLSAPRQSSAGVKSVSLSLWPIVLTLSMLLP